MRTVLPVLAVLTLLGAVAGDRPATAQPFQHYPFCLFTGGDEMGFERCSYTSFQQCLEDRRAEGGVCYANPAYRPAAVPRR